MQAKNLSQELSQWPQQGGRLNPLLLPSCCGKYFSYVKVSAGLEIRIYRLWLFLMPKRNGLLNFDIQEMTNECSLLVIFNPEMLTKCTQFYFKSNFNKPSLTQLV